MANLKKGRWVLDAKNDAVLLARFFQGCREQGCETQGAVVNCPEGSFDWPPHWRPAKGEVSVKNGDEWYGMLHVDQCPQAPKWDVSLVQAVQPWNVVTSIEGHTGDWRNAAIVWGVAAFFAGASSSIVKWSRSASEAKCWYIERVSLPRLHEETGPLPAPGELFTDALRECMARHGVRVCEPNYQGVSVQISTPSISRPAIEYMMSLMTTQRDLANAGAASEWALERWNADIGMARAHILSEFLRTKHTHLLLIDDDMAWESQAVHRLFWADKDIVAVAGPKKSYPLRFAASKVDANGMPTPLDICPESGAAEVDSVGAAFMLLKRDAVQRLVDAYPSLKFTGVDGKPSWALYLQQIQNDRYLPEDFSFCQRWRAIGGKMYICPDVAIGHVGQHIYSGSLAHDSGRAGL